MEKLSPGNVSLVLGGGGARGLTQIGVIKVLEEKGFVIDEIVGCSIGSLVGGLYALDKLDIFEKWVVTLTRRDVYGLMDFGLPTSGIVKGIRIMDKLKEMIPDTTIETLPIAFSAVITELRLEKDLVITSGSLYEAIRASIAIPGIFTMVNRQDKLIVDGGVLNPLPLSHVKKRKENIVIAVNLDGYSDTESEDFQHGKIGMFSVLQHTYTAMRRQLSKLAIEFYRPDYIINVPKNIAGTMEFEKAAFLIERGKELALQAFEGETGDLGPKTK